MFYLIWGIKHILTLTSDPHRHSYKGREKTRLEVFHINVFIPGNSTGVTGQLIKSYLGSNFSAMSSFIFCVSVGWEQRNTWWHGVPGWTAGEIRTSLKSCCFRGSISVNVFLCEALAKTIVRIFQENAQILLLSKHTSYLRCQGCLVNVCSLMS